MHRSKKIAHGGDSNGVCISLRLNNDLTASDRVGIKCNRIYPTVSTGSCDLHLPTITSKLFLKKFADKVLKIQPVHGCEIYRIVQFSYYSDRKSTRLNSSHRCISYA